MNLIEQLKQKLGQTAEPLARAALRLGIGPNAITTTGLIVMLAAATAFGGGAVRWGAALLLLGGLFDVLDGPVARLGKRTTTFGAFYDATLDRVGESAVCAGIALFFLRGGVTPDRETLAVMVAIAALASSLVASYARARAGALGIEARVGIPAPAARAILVGVPALLFGAGPNGALLFWMMVAFAIVTATTAVQRVVHVARSADRGAPPAAKKRDTLPGHATARNRLKPRGDAPR